MSGPTETSRNPKAGTFVFALAFLVCAVVLLIYLPDQTKFSAKGKLFAQPRFWPAVGVIGMVVFGAFHALSVWRRQSSGAAGEVLTWARALEYLLWFMVYVWAVPIIGYLLATVVFTVVLALRQGFRRRSHLVVAIVLGFAIVVIFKAGLAVKIPGGTIYEYLPAGLRNFMIVNF